MQLLMQLCCTLWAIFLHGARLTLATVRGPTRRVGPPDLLIPPSGPPFSLVLAEAAFEEAPVPLLVAQGVYDHVLRDVIIDSLGRLDDLGVVLNRPGLDLDHALAGEDTTGGVADVGAVEV
jgi:hypothetical protein